MFSSLLWEVSPPHVAVPRQPPPLVFQQFLRQFCLSEEHRSASPSRVGSNSVTRTASFIWSSRPISSSSSESSSVSISSGSTRVTFLFLVFLGLSSLISSFPSLWWIFYSRQGLQPSILPPFFQHSPFHFFSSGPSLFFFWPVRISYVAVPAIVDDDLLPYTFFGASIFSSSCFGILESKSAHVFSLPAKYSILQW
ncbi:unnamed protein product [Acanthosepion pharaonis]|uniref:Transmembrane protein n=1 Tax=Acanthosepion pharaonis TaxID=158019 RepID=A0A812DFI7_ACAPH|nr:unnamed protein product [Sepia pharaonis]